MTFEEFKAQMIAKGWGTHPDDTEEALKVLYDYHIGNNKTLPKVETREPDHRFNAMVTKPPSKFFGNV